MYYEFSRWDIYKECHRANEIIGTIHQYIAE